MNQEFTITFWIRTNKNPAWSKTESKIDFPPFTPKNGIKVFVSKINRKIKVYILHPEIGFKKISADISDYLGQDTHVAITNSKKETSLYINGKPIKQLSKKDFNMDVMEYLEKGDYVMVKIDNNDFENIRVGKNVKTVFQARVEDIDHERKIVKLNFFDLKQKKEVSIDKLVV